MSDMEFTRKTDCRSRRYIRTVKLIRCSDAPLPTHEADNSEKAAALARRWLFERTGGEPVVETFGIITTNSRNKVINIQEVSTGALGGTLVTPREVFLRAVLSQAAAIIGFHNHPSGDPEPSLDDIALTNRLVSAGKTLGIDFNDHIILGNLTIGGQYDIIGGYWSFRAHGRLQ